MNLSVCSTSFNCVEAVEEHCRSIFRALGDIDYEYVVIDNHSDDGTYPRLHAISLENPRLKLLSRRCSRGRGRQYAVALASHDTILSVDVDTIYRPELRTFVEVYFKRFRSPGLAVQAIYAGLYPRELWFQAGGMRNLNFGEDFDLWMRIWAMGRMRWTPDGRSLAFMTDRFTTRLADTHRCPVVLNALRMPAVTARSNRASSHTITAFFPPISARTRLRCRAPLTRWAAAA